ncbi:MAG TPA: glycosyltransferase family 39 protein [Candidatus Saccharimonadales bacterium]|nr:glycosyltransferase family 39 protein [Candidatus Saccharimonadales bacterium]
MKNFIKTRHEYLFLLISCLLAFCYFAWGINSWRFAYIGDDWQFYAFAKTIVQNNFHVNPFQLQGVHGQNSVLGSVYQAVFLWLFGFTNIAWRLSNVVLIIPSSIFFFLFVKREFDKNLAIISTILLQSSAYLANYFKIGYINPQSLTLFILCLYLASLCGYKPNKKNFLQLGIALGVSFYIYLGPIFPFMIWPFLIPALKSSKKTLFFNSLFLGLGYIALITPAFLNISQLNGPASKTIFAREFHDNFQILVNIFHNFLLFYRNYDYFYNHYVEGPYLDIVSQIFAFTGTLLCIKYTFKKSSYGFLAASYISTCFIIGLTSPYSYTPTTRGIFFLPFGFIFTGIGLSYLQKKQKLAPLVILILPIIVLLNVYQSQIGIFQKTGSTATTLIIKMLQEAKQSKAVGMHILLLQDGHSYNGDILPLLQQGYGLESVGFAKIYTSQLNCQILSTTREIAIFSEDYFAQQTLTSSPCFDKNVTKIRLLKPNIYF